MHTRESDKENITDRCTSKINLNVLSADRDQMASTVCKDESLAPTNMLEYCLCGANCFASPNDGLRRVLLHVRRQRRDQASGLPLVLTAKQKVVKFYRQTGATNFNFELGDSYNNGKRGQGQDILPLGRHQRVGQANEPKSLRSQSPQHG